MVILSLKYAHFRTSTTQNLFLTTSKLSTNKDFRSDDFNQKLRIFFKNSHF